MAPAAQGLDPLLSNHVVVQLCRGETATQMDFALIEQAPEPQRRGLLHPGEALLLEGEPGELGGGDDPAGEGFEKELSDRHGICNGT